LPGLYLAISASRRVSDLLYDDARAAWETELSGQATSAAREAGIARAYDGAVTRAVRVESKATAYLQVVAIGFAIVVLVIDARESVLLQLLSLVAAGFLVSATWGCLLVLRVRGRRQALVDDAKSVTSGLAEAAAAAAVMEREHVRASNYAIGATKDLIVGGIAALLAVCLMIVGVGREDEPTAPQQYVPTASTLITETTSTSISPTTSLAPLTEPPRASSSESVVPSSGVQATSR
jgi:hypothetical protein